MWLWMYKLDNAVEKKGYGCELVELNNLDESGVSAS